MTSDGAGGGVGGTSDETTSSSSSAGVAGGVSNQAFDWNSWPVISGLPLELWLVIAAFGIPGAWVSIEVLSVLPDAIKEMGGSYFGFRFGFALLLILVLVGLVGVSMLYIARRLYQRDRVGRGLAYCFAGTLVVSIALSNDQTAAETWAMILSLLGIAILALAPRVRAAFDEAENAAQPTSVVVSRTLLAIFAACALLVGVCYLLLGTVSAKYVVGGIIAIVIAIGLVSLSRRLTTADRQARIYISIGGVSYVLLLLILGRASAGLLVPIGLGAASVLCLWLPNDARVFFGDSLAGQRPLSE